MEKPIDTFNRYFCAETETYHRFATKLSMSDMEYLIYDILLRKEEGISQTNLVKMMGYPKQTVNSCCLKMEQQGVLTHTAGPYHSKIMVLTQRGRAYGEKTVGKVQEIEDEIFDAWTKEEQTTFLNLYGKYLTMLQEKEREFPNGQD